ncbi:MAG: T9SS type A sorting domain-containing protein [Bacteroidota bacterium]
MSYEVVEEVESTYRLSRGIQFSEPWGNKACLSFIYHNGYDSTERYFYNFEFFQEKVFIVGLGEQKDFWGFLPNSFLYETVYYQRGQDTLGTCFEPSALPIDPLLPEGEMLIYPNPARNKLKIELSGLKAGDYILSFMDFQARVYQQKDVQVFSERELELNLEALPAGFYMVILRAENGQILRQPLSIRK